MNRSLFDIDRTDLVIVCTEDRELIVHNGDDGSPLWLDRFDAAIAGVGTGDKRIVAVDETGCVRVFDAQAGTECRRLDLKLPVRCLAVCRGSEFLVVGEPHAFLFWGPEQIRLDVQGGRCAAIARDLKTIAIGCDDHRLRLLRMPGRVMVAEFDCGDIPQDVCAGPQGTWLVAVKDRVMLVDAEGKIGKRLTGMSDTIIRNVVMRDDESMIGLVIGQRLAVAIRYPSLDTVVSADYMDKEVIGIGFGPHPWFGVGLSGGDGNKIDMTRGAVYRTDTHPGREHHTWLLCVGGGEKAANGPEADPAPAESRSAPVSESTAEEPPKKSVPVAIIVGLILAVMTALIYFGER